MTMATKPNLINIFPRIMGNPLHREIVYNAKQRNAYIEKWARTDPVYISVYPFTKIFPDDIHKTHQYAKINLMTLDFDSDHPYNEMLRFHKFLDAKNIIHRIHLSGRGFHVYFWIQDNLKNPKIAISNYWDYLHGDKEGKYENPFNKSKKYVSPMFDICHSTRGDMGQLIRYPNSKHFKRDCYCIVIDKYLLYRFHTIEEFREFAKKQYKPRKIYFGSERLDISEFDCGDEEANELDGRLSLSVVNYGDIEEDDSVDFDIKQFPYCIQTMITKEAMTFPIRNEVIKFLVNQREWFPAYTLSEIMGILKKISKYNLWLRWFYTHLKDFIIYRNAKIVYDNPTVLNGCYKINQMGLCNKDKCEWEDIHEKEGI